MVVEPETIPGGRHATLITGWDNDRKMYRVWNPSWSTSSNSSSGAQVAGHGWSGSTEYERYANYMAHVKITLTVSKETSPGIVFYLKDDPEPIQLRLTDPRGRRTGYDPESGEILQEDEQAYLHDFTSFTDPLLILPQDPAYRYLAVREPDAGGYGLEVFGTGNGPFVLTLGHAFGVTETDGPVVTGDITLGEVVRYEIFREANGALTVDEVAVFDPRAKAGNDASVFLGGEVRFDGRGSYQISGNVADYSWDFGDGQTATGAEQQHTYATAGVFTATLTVTNEEGLSGTDERTVTVIDPATLPQMETLRVSVDANDQQGTGASFYPRTTPDGRYVTFASQAPDLVPSDTNGAMDIFLKDLLDGSIERINVATSGEEDDGGTNAEEWGSAMTPDGNLVVFKSGATNFYAGDVPGSDLFIRDRAAQTTEVIAPGSYAQAGVSISDDGRWVAFDALGNLDPLDVDSASDVYLYDRQTTTLTCVSCEASGGGTLAQGAAISGDGSIIVFQTSIGTFPGDANGIGFDVYAYDRATTALELISVDAMGMGFPVAQSWGPTVSADGRYVAFVSQYNLLVPGDNNGAFGNDVFLRDRLAATTERISQSSTNEATNGFAQPGDVSADGRFVAFADNGDNLAPGGPMTFQAYLRDRQEGTTTRTSVNANYVDADAPVPVTGGYQGFNPRTSVDGAVVFWTAATNLVPNDTNGAPDVFVRRLDPATAPVTTPLANLGGPYQGWAASNDIPAGIRFDASESVDPQGRPLVGHWDFGDGSPVLDAGLVTNHSYATPGT
ncbi:MAG: PKD domain-containing protein, partial [Myxococcales bacterium]|nr:PKD domain-containing protein [Myxococcales bacterium]